MKPLSRAALLMGRISNPWARVSGTASAKGDSLMHLLAHRRERTGRCFACNELSSCRDLYGARVTPSSDQLTLYCKRKGQAWSRIHSVLSTPILQLVSISRPGSVGAGGITSFVFPRFYLDILKPVAFCHGVAKQDNNDLDFYILVCRSYSSLGTAASS